MLQVSSERSDDEDSSSDGGGDGGGSQEEEEEDSPVHCATEPSTALYAPKPAYDQLEVYRMTRRLSVLSEEGEDSVTPSPRGRRHTAPPTHLDSLLHPFSAPSPPPLHHQRPPTTSSTGLTFSTEHFSESTNEVLTITSSNSPDHPVISTELKPSSISETQHRPSELKLDTSEAAASAYSACSRRDGGGSSGSADNSRRPSPFEMAKEFFEPVTSGLFGLAFSGSTTVGNSTKDNNGENGSPDGSCSPLLSPVSPVSITSQVLALTSPVSPFPTSPSPKLPSLHLSSSPNSRSGPVEQTFIWNTSTQPSSSRRSSSHIDSSTSPVVPLSDFQLPPPSSSTSSRRSDHSFRSPTSAPAPVDSGYSDDTSLLGGITGGGGGGGNSPRQTVDKSGLISRLLESTSSSSSDTGKDDLLQPIPPLVHQYSRTSPAMLCHQSAIVGKPPLSANKSTSTDSESTVESFGFAVSGDSEPLLRSTHKGSLQQQIPRSSLYNNLPLSQCRPLKLSKPYSKLINQTSDEERPSPTIEVSDAEAGDSGGEIKPGPITALIEEDEKEDVRRDSLTLPTTTWNMFKRRRSSGTSDPSPANSPVYCTPPETSPWGSPCPSLDLQDAFNQLESLTTPFQTPRPSFSHDRSPLAHHGTALSAAATSSRRSPSLLTPRAGGGSMLLPHHRRSQSSSSDDQLVVVLESSSGRSHFDSSSRISSAPVTPYVTPQPSPTTEEGTTPNTTSTVSSSTATAASPRARGRRHHSKMQHYKHHRQSC